MSIEEVQRTIIDEFSLLDGDMEMTISYIIELGEKLPPLDEALRTDDNVVKGCQSKVWLSGSLDQDKVFFQADSNTVITKGLVSLLMRIFNGRTPDEILHADLFFMNEIGMQRFIGTQRSNGFSAMIKQFKLYGLAFKTKLESKS